MRKGRLAAIAKDRLAYQEYVETRDALDKSIASTYSKLQKKDGPKSSKKKKKGETNGVNGVNGVSGPPVPLPNPASLGLGPDDGGQLVVPEALMQLVHTRQEWESLVGSALEEMEETLPGRTRGLPPYSVFEGVDEEVRRQVDLYSGRRCDFAGADDRMDTSHANGVP